MKVSEAYFARLLGLPFVAMISERTSRRKIAEIEFYGGQCHPVPPNEIYAAATELARSTGGHYMDQFTYAERVTDWRGNNNIAQSIFGQMSCERHPVPEWIVVTAGTGGTTATLGRYVRYVRFRRHETRLCVADRDHSVFFQYYHQRDLNLVIDRSSNIEGIGRPRVEPSFTPEVIDHMIKVPDAASFATIHCLVNLLGRKVGGQPAQAFTPPSS